MGSSAEAVPTPSAEVLSRFFEFVEECEKKSLHAHHAILRMSLKSQKQRDRANYLRELECQRSARQSLLENDVLLHQTLWNSVLGKNLEDLSEHHDLELECQ